MPLSHVPFLVFAAFGRILNTQDNSHSWLSQKNLGTCSLICKGENAYSLIIPTFDLTFSHIHECNMHLWGQKLKRTIYTAESKREGLDGNPPCVTSTDYSE